MLSDMLDNATKHMQVDEHTQSVDMFADIARRLTSKLHILSDFAVRHRAHGRHFAENDHVLTDATVQMQQSQDFMSCDVVTSSEGEKAYTHGNKKGLVLVYWTSIMAQRAEITTIKLFAKVKKILYYGID